jgi:hypothetical protein
MTKSIMFVMIAAILVSGTVILSEEISDASAIKSNGTYNQKYGSATKICGDHICTPEELDTKQKAKTTPKINTGPEKLSLKSNTQMIQSKVYNETLNPRQIEYPANLGFNDLHIGAINHIIPYGDDSKLDVIVHHHCKVYDDMTAACLLFPTGMDDQDKPYGIEYIIGVDAYEGFSEEEKIFWHYHKTELPNVKAVLADLTAEEAEDVMPMLNETYGKVVYFWQLGDEYPIGQPFVVIIEDLYK